MKPEYKEKLEKLRETFVRWYNEEEAEKVKEPSRKRRDLRQERIEELNYCDDMLDELIETQDTEVLRGLLDLLKKENAGRGMVDESLPQRVMEYYPHKQIAEACLEKFDAIYDEGPDGMAYVLECWIPDLWESRYRFPKGERKGIKEKGCFPEFREMFNKVQPRHAEDFLSKLEWIYRDEPKTRVRLETLREDMKKWGNSSEKEEKTETMTEDVQ
jgi:hypothetical protein